MKDLAPVAPEDASRRRWVGRGLVLLALAATAWVGWREYDHRAAVREARAAGYEWYGREPIGLIRADWRAAFQKDTWTGSYWSLSVGTGCDLARLRPLLLRLRPTTLLVQRSKDANLDALQGLSGLKRLELSGCPALQNLDALSSFSGLQMLDLINSTGVADLAPLTGLTQLQQLSLYGCTGVADLTPLAGLAQLQWLDLGGCTGVADLTPPAGLARLRVLDLRGCTGLSAEAVAAFQAQHPTTTVVGP